MRAMAVKFATADDARRCVERGGSAQGFYSGRWIECGIHNGRVMLCGSSGMGIGLATTVFPMRWELDVAEMFMVSSYD